jgi:DNA primase
MGNLFETVKESVTAKDAAEQYGLEVKRGGMACCPFHPDRHPSMKVNQDYYYCFSCGARGDVIALTAQLLGLDALTAAKRLAEDFSIPYEERKPEKPAKPATPPPKDEKVRRVEQRLDKWLHHAEGGAAPVPQSVGRLAGDLPP